MTVFVAVTLLLSYVYGHYYADPSPSYRIFPDLSITTATIAGLLAVNTAVVLAFRIMPLWPFLTRYFMHTPAYPLAIQAVTNVFSHVQYEHFLANMFMLLLVAPVCLDLVGRGVFLGTYVSAGAFGSLATLYWANLGRGNLFAHSVGASAALWGIAALYCVLTEQETVKIPFIKDAEVAFWPKALLGAFIVMEVLNARKGRASTHDHASHFGGMAVGLAVGGYFRATGFHERRIAGLGQQGSVQARAGVGAKTVDVGAVAEEGVKEVRDALVGSKES